MKSLNILSALLHDASRTLGVDMSRDWLRIQSRLQAEGVSFLTITLPAFSSWLEQSLEAERTLQTVYSSFRKSKHRAAPCFLQGLTERIFDKCTGDLRSDADPSAVFFIRSICTFFKKVKLPCTQVRNDMAVRKFVDTDACLPDKVEVDSVTRSVAYVVISSLFYFKSDESLPKHGKGATFEKIAGNRKYEGRDFYKRWLPLLDPEDLYGHAYGGDRGVDYVEEAEEKPCRLSLVPKTLKTPRIIAVEPLAMQYAQQLCADRLIRSMRRSVLTRHIDFTDQTVNRDLAKAGSIDRSVSTIDLSEASDRVSLPLVEALFGSDPGLLAELLAFRSTHIKLPDGAPFGGVVMPLKKYSTSGSALTFPVESLVFFILALGSVVKSRLHDYGDLRSAISHLARNVNVYGDDIVVPSDTCREVIASLEAVGLKVNRGKTFYEGYFRESCGGDYFKGYDVTPTYLRHMLASDLSQSDAMCSSVSTSNILFKKGCWLASDYIREAIDSIRKLPVVLSTCPGLGWHGFTDAHDHWKVLPNFHMGVRTLVPYTKPVKDTLDGYSALLKHFLSKGVQEERDHLSHTVPRFRSRLRLKWVTPY